MAPKKSDISYFCNFSSFLSSCNDYIFNGFKNRRIVIHISDDNSDTDWSTCLASFFTISLIFSSKNLFITKLVYQISVFSSRNKSITLHDRITSNESVITWKVNRSELGGSRSKFGSFTKRIPVSMSILKNVVVISSVYPSMGVSF